MIQEKKHEIEGLKKVAGTEHSEIPAEPIHDGDADDEESEEPLGEDVCFALICSFAYEGP